MAPLSIEVYNSERSQWVQAGEIKPGDRPGSMSQNLPDGPREVYTFECSQDDSQSTIYRSPIGIDISGAGLRAVLSDRSAWEIVKVLKKEDEPFTLTVGTDISPQRRIIKFTHK